MLGCSTSGVLSRTAPIRHIESRQSSGPQRPRRAGTGHRTKSSRELLRVSANQETGASAKSAEAQVKEKVDEALKQAQDTHKHIQSSTQESEQEAEKSMKEQKFRRAKQAMRLKEQGHNIDPSAGHEPEAGSANDSKAARTRENATKDEAQVPDGTIRQSVCQRLMALEELAASRPRIKLVSRGEPIPKLRHHYAAAAWWAVA